MRREPLRSAGQRLVHVFVVGAGWFLFGWAWLLVGRDLPDYGVLAWMIVATLVISPAITLYWVLHNLAIFKLKGPRLRLPEAKAEYLQDWAGRPVVADWTTLRTARITVIGVVDSRKLYRCLAPRSVDPGVSRLFGKG
ncbi:hypothetical protein BSY238_3307 [Methyloversatilis sp. RAC08]|uniref:hypothetical protein n=1 Tax=Methyloversatilis sp. RAC08 TaxID=1842540 RepID=UPI00083DBEB7|nr:hypothetical protein [Methyloversatilis sp. RAC08]AOF82987.1 hypothetical protein BSY238_3307 [Methyloversatilis sp. RAC08]